MPDFVTNVVAVVIVLGIMILIHEWGHFIAAKSFGVRVEIFSIGFGPRLWGRRRGDTDYRLSALPLGGYVKMAGDNPVEERVGAADEFLSRPRWQRAIIAVAGPTMNVLLSILLIAGLFMVGMPQRVYEDEPVVVAGVLKDSPAEKAGIRAGDRVVEFNGVSDPTWNEALTELLLTTGSAELPVVVERQGRRMSFTVKGAPLRGGGDEFLLLGFPQEPVVVGRVNPGQPADRAGLQRNDQIVAINGEPLLGSIQFASRIQELAGQPAELQVRRGSEEVRLQIRPVYGDPGDGVKRWSIGIGFGQRSVFKSYPVTEAVPRAVWFNVRMTREILLVVARLFQGKVSIKQLEGPVGIARQSGQAVKQGPVAFVLLMAVISLNLGILNLLPIPILDGGHILLLSVEGLLRRDLSVAIKERFVQVGLVFLLVIFAIVMYNDVLKTLPGR